MLSDAAIVMIALLAVGLAPTGRSPAIVMRLRDLCAANAGTSAGVVVHIRPNVAMSCFIFSFRASRAGMIMRISTVSPPGLPGMPESIAVWLLASCADCLGSTGCRSTGMTEGSAAIAGFSSIAAGTGSGFYGSGCAGGCCGLCPATPVMAEGIAVWLAASGTSCP